MAVELMSVFTNIWTAAVAFSPKVVGAIILLVIGLVLGKIIGRVVKEILERSKLDYYVTETHKPVISLSNIFAVIVKWWIYLAFITAAVSKDVLGITALAGWMSTVNMFIPKIIGATTVIVVGYVLAEYIKEQLKKTGKIYAVIVSKVLFFFILYVSIAISLPILGVSATLVNNILLVIIASVGLGIAIALGLGLKDAISDISKRYVKKIKV